MRTSHLRKELLTSLRLWRRAQTSTRLSSCMMTNSSRKTPWSTTKHTRSTYITRRAESKSLIWSLIMRSSLPWTLSHRLKKLPLLCDDSPISRDQMKGIRHADPRQWWIKTTTCSITRKAQPAWSCLTPWEQRQGPTQPHNSKWVDTKWCKWRSNLLWTYWWKAHTQINVGMAMLDSAVSVRCCLRCHSMRDCPFLNARFSQPSWQQPKQRLKKRCVEGACLKTVVRTSEVALSDIKSFFYSLLDY